MKNIKFRIWDKQLKVFLYQLPEKHHLDWERFNVQQFTGLSDRLGKEIYEGDLIKHFDKGQISLVEWSSGDWGWYMKSVKNWNPKTGFDSSLDEVIGNIYESKHLLDNTDTKVRTNL